MGCRPSKLQPVLSSDRQLDCDLDGDAPLRKGSKGSSLLDYSHLEQVAMIDQGTIRIRMVNRNDADLNDRVQTRKRSGTPKAVIRHEEAHTQLIVEFTGQDSDVARKLSGNALAHPHTPPHLHPHRAPNSNSMSVAPNARVSLSPLDGAVDR